MIDYFAAVTFLTPTGDIPVGAKIPKDLFSEEQLARLLKAGDVTTLEAEQDKLDKKFGAKPFNGVVTFPDWAFDPETLKNDSLDVLNLKIAGRAQELAQEVEPFETREDAIVFMTADFKAGS